MGPSFRHGAVTLLAVAALAASPSARAADTKSTLTSAGAASLGIFTLMSIPPAVFDPGSPGLARLIPVVGPVWGAVCAFGRACNPSMQPSVAIGLGESVVAAGQLTGIVLLTIGLTMQRPVETYSASSLPLKLGLSSNGVTWSTTW
jgi:hypothetical protein